MSFCTDGVDDEYQHNGHLSPVEEAEEEEDEEEDEYEEELKEREREEGERPSEEVARGSGEEETSPKTKAIWQKVAAKSLDMVEEEKVTSLEERQENGGEEQSGWNKVKRVRIQKAKRPSKLQLGGKPTPKLVAVMKQAQSIYLREGESHQVWRPKKQLSDVVKELNKKELDQERQPSPDKATRQLLQTPTVSKSSLRSRQKTVFNRALATQAVLKETTDELLNEADEEEGEASKPKISLKEASKRITANLKKQESNTGVGSSNISSVVSQYLAKLRAEGGTDLLSSGGSDPATSPLIPMPTKRRQATKRVAFTDTPGAVELKQWKKLVRNAKTQSTQIVNQRENFDSGRSKTQYPLHIPGTPQEDQTLTSSGHRKIHKTTSDSSVTKHVGFSDHSPQPSPSPRTKSPGMEFTHQPLAKRDSNEVHKQSKMAEMKKRAKDRRPTVQRQEAQVNESFGSSSVESDGAESSLQVTPPQDRSKGKTGSLEAFDERQRKASTGSVDSQGRPKRSSPDQGWVQDPNEERSKTPPTPQGRASSLSRQRLMKVEPAPQTVEEKDERPGSGSGSRPGSSTPLTSI